MTNLSFCASKFQSTGLAGSMGIGKYMSSGSDVKVTQNNFHNHESISSVRTKKLSPTNKKEHKAILNYFSANKQKLKELGRCDLDESDANGSCSMFDDCNTLSNEFSTGLKKTEYVPSANKSNQNKKPVEQKYRDGYLLHPISITSLNNREIKHDIREIKSDRSDTLGDILSEDPLDHLTSKISGHDLEKTECIYNDLNSLPVQKGNSKVDYHVKGKQEINDVTTADAVRLTTSSPDLCTKNDPKYEKTIDKIYHGTSNPRDDISCVDKLPETSAQLGVSSNSNLFRGKYIQGDDSEDTMSNPGVTSKFNSLFSHVCNTSSNPSGTPTFGNNKVIRKERRSSYESFNRNILKTDENHELSPKEEKPLKNVSAPKVLINCLGDQKRYGSEERIGYSRTSSSNKSLFSNSTNLTETSREGYFVPIVKGLNEKEKFLIRLKPKTSEKKETSLHKTESAKISSKISKANTRISKANTKTSRANTKTSKANTKTSKANTKTSKANTKISKANTKISKANTNFFESGNDIPSNYASENDVMSCEKCGKRILVWDLPEHVDFHYAKELQDSMKKEFLCLYNDQSKSSVSPPKKKSKQNNLMLKYFSPAGNK